MWQSLGDKCARWTAPADKLNGSAVACFATSRLAAGSGDDLARLQTAERRALVAVQQLKSNLIVEFDGTSHVADDECDCADKLDHPRWPPRLFASSLTSFHKCHGLRCAAELFRRELQQLSSVRQHIDSAFRTHAHVPNSGMLVHQQRLLRNDFLSRKRQPVEHVAAQRPHEDAVLPLRKQIARVESQA